jgi:putative heme-binding domain-containing protein
MVCYQHRQFPEKYREALFALDWTFGRVLALSLKRHGAVWQADTELFLSAAGDHGFAPTDAEVGPDGSLFVSVGGRGTRGGVWRVSYSAYKEAKRSPPGFEDDPLPDDASASDKLAACLTVPQPLSSWSRARWQPLARQLGREVFLSAARNDSLLPAVRLRAIDTLTELFGGLEATEASDFTKTTPAEVRAKAIWSLGRTHASPLDLHVAKTFLEDSDPLVNRAALEAILSADVGSDWSLFVPGIAQQFGSDDRFNRLTASRLIARLDAASFQTLSAGVSNAGWQTSLMYAVGSLPRSTAATKYALKVSLGILEGQHPSSLKLQAARLLQLALGDMVPAAGVPAFEAYSTKLDLSAFERDLDPLRVRLVETFPTGDAAVDRELSRALAMLSLANSKLLDKVLAKITDESDPIEDIHYLLVAARIPTPRNRSQAETIARGLVQLEPKIVARKLTQDLHWDDRVGELFLELSKLDEELADQLIAQPEFGRPGHVLFLSRLPQDLLPKVVESYVQTVSNDAEYPWNNDVVFLIGESKQPEHRELLRRQFDQFKIRGAVLVVLARQPEERDRDKFVEGLDESRLEVLTACADALAKFKPSQNPAEQIALLRALRRLGSDEKEFPIREKVARLLTRNFNRDFGFVLGQTGYRPQPEAIQRWTEFLSEKYPAESARALGGDAETLKWLTEQLAAVDWAAGDVERGRQLFEKRSCAQCHGGRQGLGPDLAGVASRFSRDDLFLAIVLPSRDVSTRYQTTLIETKQGKVHTGLIVYESAEGVLLRNSTNQTLRIETHNVETRRTLPQSLMPTGLLKEFRSADFADLLAYLKSLSRPAGSTTTAR